MNDYIVATHSRVVGYFSVALLFACFDLSIQYIHVVATLYMFRPSRNSHVDWTSPGHW